MLAPRNMGADYTAQFDAIYPGACRELTRVVFYPFFLEGVASDPHLNQGDGLHPNAAGVDVIVAADPAQGRRADCPRRRARPR